MISAVLKKKWWLNPGIVLLCSAAGSNNLKRGKMCRHLMLLAGSGHVTGGEAQPSDTISHILALEAISMWPVCSFPVSWPLTQPRCSSHFKPNQQLWAGGIPPLLLSVCSWDCSAGIHRQAAGRARSRCAPPFWRKLPGTTDSHPNGTRSVINLGADRRDGPRGGYFGSLKHPFVWHQHSSLWTNSSRGWVSNVWTRTREYGDELWCKHSWGENKK